MIRLFSRKSISLKKNMYLVKMSLKTNLMMKRLMMMTKWTLKMELELQCSNRLVQKGADLNQKEKKTITKPPILILGILSVTQKKNRNFG
jgi:hypothetical protein